MRRRLSPGPVCPSTFLAEPQSHRVTVHPATPPHSPVLSGGQPRGSGTRHRSWNGQLAAELSPALAHEGPRDGPGTRSELRRRQQGSWGPPRRKPLLVLQKSSGGNNLLLPRRVVRVRREAGAAVPTQPPPSPRRKPRQGGSDGG